ncbi:TPA_asm: hypothetical protein [Porphyromonas phage phage017a_JCVISC001]|uniref:Uncharacterized protein n=3 Tax=Dewhirstvirus TaxID=3425072 RepID=A0AAT9JJ54_9CAUD
MKQKIQIPRKPTYRWGKRQGRNASRGSGNVTEGVGVSF